MIGRLTGRVVAEEADGTIVLDVAGVGYEVTAPLGTMGRAREEAGSVTLFVHTHVREDTLALFGFATEADRLAFRTLIGVSNVGPRTAVAVLSALPAAELARAIASKDIGKLTSISGIGKKTAERLLLELRDKLEAPPPSETNGAPPAARAPTGSHAELLASALTRMGYRPSEAERAVAALGERVHSAPMADLVKEALVLLAK
jgi:Holliday junction DNA helicase RuvA